jgi:D-3-phosphoglycerate dehydrogenase / 2-oxoglutarate reductase
VNILVTTAPFGEVDRTPIELLEGLNCVVEHNPFGRRLTEAELVALVPEYDVIIAGTEPITQKVFANAPNLKLISRVGIGVDSVDLQESRRRQVKVSYTPDAPSPAVAELTLGLMLSMLRRITMSNNGLRDGQWHRHFGRRLSESVVGIIGFGRIGKRVAKLLGSFECRKILINDVNPLDLTDVAPNCHSADKEEIYRQADIISVHVPLTISTKGMVGAEQIKLMKPDALLVNTARGGVIDEQALFAALTDGVLSGAAIDVFESEPYVGPLRELEHCLLTAHMGSMTRDCRARMEIEATQEVVRFVQGKPLESTVPTSEYEIQAGESELGDQR